MSTAVHVCIYVCVSVAPKLFIRFWWIRCQSIRYYSPGNIDYILTGFNSRRSWFYLTNPDFDDPNGAVVVRLAVESRLEQMFVWWAWTFVSESWMFICIISMYLQTKSIYVILSTIWCPRHKPRCLVWHLDGAVCNVQQYLFIYFYVTSFVRDHGACNSAEIWRTQNEL